MNATLDSERTFAPLARSCQQDNFDAAHLPFARYTLRYPCCTSLRRALKAEAERRGLPATRNIEMEPA